MSLKRKLKEYAHSCLCCALLGLTLWWLCSSQSAELNAHKASDLAPVLKDVLYQIAQEIERKEGSNAEKTFAYVGRILTNVLKPHDKADKHFFSVPVSTNEYDVARYSVSGHCADWCAPC